MIAKQVLSSTNTSQPTRLNSLKFNKTSVLRTTKIWTCALLTLGRVKRRIFSSPSRRSSRILANSTEIIAYFISLILTTNQPPQHGNGPFDMKFETLLFPKRLYTFLWVSTSPCVTVCSRPPRSLEEKRFPARIGALNSGDTR